MNQQPDDPGTGSSEEALVKRLKGLVLDINSVAELLSRKNVEVSFDTIMVGYVGSVQTMNLTAKARKVLLS